jgi:archaellum component FlaC
MQHIYLPAIEEMMNEKLEPIYEKLQTISTRLDRIEVRLDVVETRITAVETRITGVETRLRSMDMELKELDKRFGRVEHNLKLCEQKIDIHLGYHEALAQHAIPDHRKKPMIAVSDKSLKPYRS